MTNPNPDRDLNDEKFQLETESNSRAAVGNEDAVVFSLLLSGKSGERDYNFRRLSGMIADAMYSLNKHRYIEKYVKDQGGLPTNQEIRVLMRSFQDEDSYRLQALEQQSANSLKEVIDEYVGRIAEEKFARPVEKIVKDNTKFWIAVRASIVASFIYSLLIAAAIFTATAALPDTKFARIIQILIE